MQTPLGSILLARVGGLAALAVALHGCGGSFPDTGPGSDSGDDVAAQRGALLAGERAFSCEQTTVTRAAYKQAVSGVIDDAGTPRSVVVTRVKSGAVDIASPSPTLDNGWDGGYWKTTYHENEWLLGTTRVGSPSKTYHLMLPQAPPGTGAAFSAMVKTDFDGGKQGNWQFQFACR